MKKFAMLTAVLAVLASCAGDTTPSTTPSTVKAVGTSTDGTVYQWQSSELGAINLDDSMAICPGGFQETNRRYIPDETGATTGTHVVQFVCLPALEVARVPDLQQAGQEDGAPVYRLVCNQRNSLLCTQMIGQTCPTNLRILQSYNRESLKADFDAGIFRSNKVRVGGRWTEARVTRFTCP